MQNVLMPNHIRNLPRNQAGYPVPWFVAWIDGEPDFRVIGEKQIYRAVKERLCFICGKPRRPRVPDVFAIGPMCAVNRISAEPPSHYECALYAVQACPFLVNPKKRRREGRKPLDAVSPAGEMIRRNPGVTLLWTSRAWSIRRQPEGGVLFNVGDPLHVEWFAEGRTATRAEVLASIETGLPLLREMAEAEGDAATKALDQLTVRALELVPQ